MVAIKNITRALCTTPACIQLAEDYVKNLAPNYKDLDPCTNFEEMVCGGWRARNTIPPTQLGFDRMTDLSMKGDDLLRSILEGEYPGDSSHSHFSPRNLHRRDLSVDQENFVKLQTSYKACMDTDTLTKVGIAPIKDLLERLKKTFGGPDWSAPSIFVTQIGGSALTGIYIASDLDDPDVQLPNLQFSAWTGLPRSDLYTNASVVQDQYVPVMAGIMQAVQGGNTTTNYTEQARQIAKLETDLYAISSPSNKTFYELASKLPLSKADALAPELAVTKLFAAFAPPNLTADIDVLLYTPYLGNLTKVLSSYPRETIEAYFEWAVILQTRHAVFADDIFAPYTKLRDSLRGISITVEPAPRWKSCLSLVSMNLGWILSRFFIEHTFSAHDRDLSNQVISDIRQVYTAKFKSLSWMDEPTRTKAIDKVTKIVQKIGYPTDFPNITNPDVLQKYYADTPVTTSHFDNELTANTAQLLRNFKLLGHPTDRLDWSTSYAFIVNAFYSWDVNQITFPAGILQSPVFGGDFPSAINYGAFGAVAGHEVSHGFDKNGKNFDGTGKLTNWWSEDVLAEYLKREKCFVEQFGNMTAYPNDGKTPNSTGFKMDGQKTLGENEADSAGIVAAWEAWQLRRKMDGNVDMALPGLEDWTDEQLFFMAYGNFWCGLASEDMLRVTTRTGVHSPNAVRVMGTTANSRAFKEAFGCKVKEPVCTSDENQAPLLLKLNPDRCKGVSDHCPSKN
ncbi:endothelin-converting enzyme [Podospora aff. communis PSN243]|uniref:Endothelin-converting enzyme n=1 Tax=Podospora aff. communis PSN243 TaxID=3040156 RepID=A0AAV9GGC2_9PEZI|nr:endothelin-converting enzyme [Podospora aff. communis PSN243]